MSKSVRFLLGFLPVLMAGCQSFHSDSGPVRFDRSTECSSHLAAALIAKPGELGNSSDTQTLTCALSALRESDDSAVLRTALGSRLCLLLAERQTLQDDREKLAQEGVSFAEMALSRGAGDDGAVHYYLAANLGLAVRDHVTLAFANLGRLEAEMKRALELSPNLDDGGPMRLLGALYLKAPAWPNGIGDMDKALELLEQAVKEHPEHPLNRLFLAQALWAQGGDAELERIKNEFSLGESYLNEGLWGYRKEPWKKEFDQFRLEFIEAAAE